MQRVEVEKPAGDWFWGEITPFLVGLFAWLFFDLCVGCCLVWFVFCLFCWVFVCFVDCLVVVAGVFNIRHVLDLLGIDSAWPQRPWDDR